MPGTILLVEDDEDILDIINYMLTDEGYRVLRSKGDGAVELATSEKPGLVLLDHRLQTVWGADICRALKEHEATRHIPVYLMSATMNLQRTAAEAGADGILPKPFDMQDLMALVTRVFPA